DRDTQRSVQYVRFGPNSGIMGIMVKRLPHLDAARIGDDKALAIAAYGESVSAYRYIVLTEKSTTDSLREAFQEMVRQENAQREAVQALLTQLFPTACFFLTAEDKSLVCVGPRLVDARDDARFDEAMRLIVASEKRSISFYSRYAAVATSGQVKTLFEQLYHEGLQRVKRLRELFSTAGKPIAEACPIQ
ncbi:MAG: ferritin family protein, partial [Phycisphaerae bacterium]